MFVALWSTGFVVAHYAIEDAGPLTFLAVRLAGAGVLLWVAAIALHAPRIDRTQARWAAIAGVGMNALYLGGVFVAINLGLPTGLSSLITGIHPVVTSIVGRWALGERLRRVQWLGIALGLLGVIAVVVDRLKAHSGSVTAGALIAMGVSVLGMSAGTIVQRSRGASMPLLRGTSVQFLTSAIVLAFGAVLNEHWRFHPTARLWFSLGWAMIVLSIASVLIMLMLLQRHAAARVSSLFFLVPALSTIEGAILFSEHIGAVVVIGLVISLAGVFLTTRQPRTKST
ncbi:MAG: EamA family transporter [Ilumatobacteraceae bacterium]|nr:EamA family transporter [Ilumatobacteraceae bacterium]